MIKIADPAVMKVAPFPPKVVVSYAYAAPSRQLARRKRLSRMINIVGQTDVLGATSSSCLKWLPGMIEIADPTATPLAPFPPKEAVSHDKYYRLDRLSEGDNFLVPNEVGSHYRE